MALPRPELLKTLRALEALDYRKTYSRIYDFKPYPKQQEFIALGVTKRERLLMAANQVGKSHVGAFETACHLTGIYPDWWLGRRFDKPVKGWAAGETTVLCRDVQQKKLCGEPGVTSDFGKGMIPKDLFVDKPSMSRGATDAYDTIQVKHVSGGTSVLRFKSYEQGRTKFQGETLDFIWCDEEPPADIYAECLTRVAATEGMVFITFTPLKGRSDVVIMFMDEESVDRAIVNMTIDDAAHFSAEQRAKVVAGYRPHEREARAKGVPMLGSGRIFLSTEEAISEPAITNIPSYWVKLGYVDFGIGHPFAFSLGLWDRDNDVIHIHHAFRIADALPIQHAAAIKRIAANVPIGWPHDGDQREKGSGQPLAALYKAQGLKMLHEAGCWPDGGNSVEAGIAEMDDRFRSGRLKIAAHLAEAFEEYRFYHRLDGKIVKKKDDIMDTIRGIVMMKRYGRAVSLGSHTSRRRTSGVAQGVDFDLS